jgi:hypothetical protein
MLLDDQESARRYPTGKIALVFCKSCGFIGNARFNPEMARYAVGYEEQQSFSPRFNAFSLELAKREIERHDLRNKTVLEIGCGKGDFLISLCELGPNTGIGVDPTYVDGRYDGPAAGRVSFIRDFYSQKYGHLKADLVCCRHTLEHISDTEAFMRTVREAIGENTQTNVFFELPDVMRVLEESAFWDIYYEHCSYFSLGSLARLFRRTGFDVLELAKEYDGQYLLIEAKPSTGSTSPALKEEDDLQALSDAVVRFRQGHERHVNSWKSRIRQWREQGQRIAIWGSGSKCVSFLSTAGITNEVDVIVDINPYRHGKYLPSSGKVISAPAVLKDYQPNVVIAMNPIYLEEIGRDLKAMGLEPELTAV